MDVTKFEIDVTDGDVTELKRRLRATRFPDVAPNRDFARGTSGEYLRELVAYWAGDFDWPAQQAVLNQLPQFTATVGEVELHFIHASAGQGRAVLLIHGWPDTPFRFRAVVQPLVDAGYDVVAPSVPGFAFSGHRALAPDDVADRFVDLMTGLGFDSFAVAGGDVGSVVGLAMARRHPEIVTALHLTNVDYPTGQEEDLSEDEQAYVDYIGRWFPQHGGYAAVQSSAPQIVGPALNDSPAGLAAWMLGLIASGADDHDVEGAFGGRDELLTNFCIYWFSQTPASAADNYAMTPWDGDRSRVAVSTGVAIFPREAPSPREWCERQAHVTRFTTMPRGGHFAALEVPDDYVEELLAFLAEPGEREPTG